MTSLATDLDLRHGMGLHRTLLLRPLNGTPWRFGYLNSHRKGSSDALPFLHLPWCWPAWGRSSLADTTLGRWPHRLLGLVGLRDLGGRFPTSDLGDSSRGSLWHRQ